LQVPGNFLQAALQELQGRQRELGALALAQLLQATLQLQVCRSTCALPAPLPPCQTVAGRAEVRMPHTLHMLVLITRPLADGSLPCPHLPAGGASR
jgi:hypothetical protein